MPLKIEFFSFFSSFYEADGPVDNIEVVPRDLILDLT
jgi:hypothetical protein